MGRSEFVWALLFCFSAVPLSSSADPITIVSSSRAIVVSAVAGDTSTGTTRLFNEDVLSNTIGAIHSRTGASATASALLVSELSPTTGTFDGRGATSTSQDSVSETSGAHAQSSYFVTLDLTSAQRVDFDAAFTLSGGNATNRSLWNAQLFQSPHGPNPLFLFNFLGNTSDAVFSRDLLAPGRYGFIISTVSDSVNSVATGFTSVDYRFSLRLSDPELPEPVPEPASMFLLGTGLAGLIAGRKRLHRSA